MGAWIASMYDVGNNAFDATPASCVDGACVATIAAWLGLTPRQYSTGGRTRLGRITKRGDIYLRTLLVHGARSELIHTPGRKDTKSQWVENLKHTKSWNKTAVALANKHARIAWALLANNDSFQPQPTAISKMNTDSISAHEEPAQLEDAYNID